MLAVFAFSACGEDEISDAPPTTETRSLSGEALEGVNRTQSSEPTDEALKARIAQAETASKQDQEAFGLPVVESRCVPSGGQVDGAMDCVTKFEYGPERECAVIIRHGKVVQADCMSGGDNGDWYRECVASGGGERCEELGQAQMDECMKTPSGLKLCTQIVYGTAKDE